MAKSKRIIPEFMINNPGDSFMFLMPLNIRVDIEEDIANSYFNVLVKNLTTKEYFTTLIAPEVFFTNFKFQRIYTNGKLDKQKNKKNKQLETYRARLHINNIEQKDVSLGELLSDMHIGQLLNYNLSYLHKAKELKCYLIQNETNNVIIPHYAIAVYYYYRSTLLREAVLRGDLSSNYIAVDCNPADASIIVPKYVSQNDTPFIHRFLCQDDANSSFHNIGNYLMASMRVAKDKFPLLDKFDTPIKASFPTHEVFDLTVNGTLLELEDKKVYYVHEIKDDFSSMGFSKFTTFVQSNKVIMNTNEELGNIQTMPINNPSGVSQRLKSTHASRKYKQNTLSINRRQSCGSLNGLDISAETITNDEITQHLRIYEEQLDDETIDQSLTDASANKDKKIGKIKISTIGDIFTKVIEPIDNFKVFNKYYEYMQTQHVLIDLQDYPSQPIIDYIDEKYENSKCFIYGRARHFITATFQYKKRYVGLLELENNTSTSTWVISSNQPIEDEDYTKFLKLYFEDEIPINTLKELYPGKNGLKFRTKNHESASELEDNHIKKWMIGVISKI